MSTIDEQHTVPESADDWASAVARTLNDQRARTRRFLQRQEQRFAELYGQLAARQRESGTRPAGDGQGAAPDQSEQIEQLHDEIKQLQTELQRAESAGSESNSQHDSLLSELQALRSERQELIDRLTKAETPLEDRRETPAVDQQQYDDLRRRFEMAVEDVRELKAKNAELEQQRQQGADSKVNPPADDSGGNLDWEAQKRRLMAQLEDFDDDDEDEARDRLTIEGAIRITDQVVAEKEQQIEEMKCQLARRPAEADQSQAVADVLDADEVVRNEREKLRLLQEHWQEKLRKAEIEISVERAKLARERATMEEQIQSYEAQIAQLSAAESASPDTDGTKKSGRGNWLSRLGLTGDD